MPEAPPSVTAVLPTLNAERYLDACLGSLRAQEYAGDLEILLIDGGSTDGTLEIAARYGVDDILSNPLRSGEAGKAVGIRAARGELVLHIDSDNSLVGNDWLTRMTRPFVEDPEVIGCEPARFAYVRDDHYINRWHALLGTADPVTLYIGNYARESVLTGSWTGLPTTTEAREGWERLELDPRSVPTLGANGFIIRRSAYELEPVGDYLFDIDYVHDLVARGHRIFARADVAVHHSFCDSIARFRAKTRRRVDDFYFFSAMDRRTYPWAKKRSYGIALFVLATVAVVPVLVVAVRGHRRAPDAAAWAWHPLACWITLLTYLGGTVRGRLRPRMLDRDGWKQ